MPTRDRLARETKQGATSIVKFGWHINIIERVFINNLLSHTVLYAVVIIGTREPFLK
jgi:hypothetical protein